MLEPNNLTSKVYFLNFIHFFKKERSTNFFKCLYYQQKEKLQPKTISNNTLKFDFSGFSEMFHDKKRKSKENNEIFFKIEKCLNTFKKNKKIQLFDNEDNKSDDTFYSKFKKGITNDGFLNFYEIFYDFGKTKGFTYYIIHMKIYN